MGAEGTTTQPEVPRDTRVERMGGGSLRVKAARGTIINGVFLTGVQVLSLLRGLMVAAFLTREEYGVWGIVMVIHMTVWTLRQAGVGERFVQQDTDDTERSFQLAFTIDLLLGFALCILGVPLVLALAGVTGLPEVVAPGLVMLLTMPLVALQMPLAVFYRRMDFARQRILQSVDPLLGFVVTLTLAASGAGYWSMVVGAVSGAVVGAAVAVAHRPFPLRLTFDRAELPGYFAFSWPIVVAGMSGIVLGQGLVIAGEAELGLAGVGIIAVCAVVSQIADRASRAVTDTMFPAICAVKDRAELLHEAFITSNRLALIWGVPFGIGLALFAEDVLVRGFGSEWASGVDLMRATAISLAIQQLAFNWSAFFRARGDTKPMAAAGVIGVALFFAVILPLLLAYGLDGLALAVLITAPLTVAVRFFYLRRLFPTLAVWGHVSRSVAPSVAPVVAVLAMRAAVGDADRGAVLILAELTLYVGLTGLGTWLLERDLLREVGGYLRGRVAAA